MFSLKCINVDVFVVFSVVFVLDCVVVVLVAAIAVVIVVVVVNLLGQVEL